MINNSQNIHFEAKKNLKKVLPKVKNAIADTLPGIRYPNKLATPGLPLSPEVKDLNNRLGFVRAFIKTLYPEGGVVEYFRGQIGIIQAFKVAHCDEMAEISKTALKSNGIKNCDIFQLFAKKANSNERPRPLDHTVTVIGVKKSLNNKQSGRPFTPRKGITIFDFYLDGFIGGIKRAKKKYAIFGLKPDETLMLKPLKSYEPDKKTFEKVKKEFPKLIINK